MHCMEIVFVDESSVRIKGKHVTFLVNPSSKNKIPTDATLLIGSNRLSNFFDSGILFQGPGEYEVKGTKVTGFATDKDVMYTIMIDGMSVFVGSVAAAVQAKDTLHEHNIAILFANEALSQTTMGILNANVLVFLGEKAQENATTFGKEFAKVSKYVVTKEKLPSETEFVFLG